MRRVTMTRDGDKNRSVIIVTLVTLTPSYTEPPSSICRAHTFRRSTIGFKLQIDFSLSLSENGTNGES